MNLQFEAPFAERPTTVTASQPINNTWVFAEGPFGPLHYVSRAFVPEEIAPGGAVDVEVDVTNAARSVLPTDPNECTVGPSSGLETTITATPSWDSSESLTVCVETAGVTNTVETFEADFPAPSDPGTYSVAVEVTTPDGSGGTVVYEVVVLEGGDERGEDGCRSDSDCPNGQVCRDGECVSAGNPFQNLIDALTFGTDSAAAPLVILVVILVALLYLTAI